MRKKLVYFFIACVFVVGSSYFLLRNKLAEGLSSHYCAFCDPHVLNYQKFYEDDLVFGLYTHKPILSGHCLVVPKRHVERFEMLSEEEAVYMNRAIKKVNQAATKVFGTSAYLLLQKNGEEVGQTVPHVHFHYIPRKAKDDSSLKFILRMYIANAQEPIQAQEMQEVVHKMKEAIEEQKL